MSSKADLINKIAGLVIENKALKETLDKTNDLMIDYQQRLEALKDLEAEKHKRLKRVAGKYFVVQTSRDELLVILNDALNDVISNRGGKDAFFVCRTDMNERKNNMPEWTKVAELAIQKAEAIKEKEHV